MVREFFITDVFYEGAFGGNPLATVVETEGLSGEDMQNIAREFNFSETTFLLGGDMKQGFDVRIFTPTDELPFAGHPTLGTAFIIHEFVEKQIHDRVELNLGVGKIPVTFANDGVLWMKQQSPSFGKVVPRAQVAQSLGLQLSDIHEDYPSQFVSTGLEFLLVPLTSMMALKQCEMIKSGVILVRSRFQRACLHAAQVSSRILPRVAQTVALRVIWSSTNFWGPAKLISRWARVMRSTGLQHYICGRVSWRVNLI